MSKARRKRYFLAWVRYVQWCDQATRFESGGLDLDAFPGGMQKAAVRHFSVDRGIPEEAI